MNNISNTADIIDTRDIVERVEELKSNLHNFYVDGEASWDAEDPDVIEYNLLSGVLNVVRDYSEDTPEDGVALIRESHFRNYAEQYWEDIRDTGNRTGNQWPYTHIDWDAAADDLRMDYTELEYDGVTYFFR